MTQTYTRYSLHVLKKKTLGSKASQTWQLLETVENQDHAVKLAKFLASLDEVAQVRLNGVVYDESGHVHQFRKINTYSAFKIQFISKIMRFFVSFLPKSLV